MTSRLHFRLLLGVNTLRTRNIKYVQQKYAIWDAPPDPLIWFVLQTLQQHQIKICNKYTWNNSPLSPTVNVSRLPSSAANEKALIPKSSLAGKPTTWKSSLTLKRSTGARQARNKKAKQRRRIPEESDLSPKQRGH